MLAPILREFLERHAIPYRVITHAQSVTAQEIAHAAHLPGGRFAKTVLLRTADGFLLAALPASETVDLARLGAAIGQRVSLATEEELGDRFPAFEVGAAPPIGSFADGGMPVVADACLAGDHEIAFNGGTHTDLIAIRWSDFERVVRPRVIDYGRPRVEDTGGLWP
jgi:Ala-tRNA(Pro) deacylase